MAMAKSLQQAREELERWAKKTGYDLDSLRKRQKEANIVMQPCYDRKRALLDSKVRLANWKKLYLSIPDNMMFEIIEFERIELETMSRCGMHYIPFKFDDVSFDLMNHQIEVYTEHFIRTKAKIDEYEKMLIYAACEDNIDKVKEFIARLRFIPTEYVKYCDYLQFAMDFVPKVKDYEVDAYKKVDELIGKFYLEYNGIEDPIKYNLSCQSKVWGTMFPAPLVKHKNFIKYRIMNSVFDALWKEQKFVLDFCKKMKLALKIES